MNYKIRLTDGQNVIEAINPDDRLCADVAKRLYSALEDEFNSFVDEVRVEMRRLKGKNPVTIKSRPIEVTISRG